MRLKLTAAVALACAAVFLPAASGAAPEGTASKRAPTGFFGIAPQTGLTLEDVRYMKAGGIDTVRLPMVWELIQPTPQGYDWSGFDKEVAMAARGRLQVLASTGSTPAWLARKYTTLPLNARQRGAWMAFLTAAVERYGPRGAFWVEHGPGTAEPVPKIPIRAWQVWNEPNFFYFAYPVSPSRYARVLTLGSKAIKRADPRADVILAGLFGKPTAKGKRGMPAATFLDRVYQTPGIKRRFDGIALHPYAIDARELAEMAEEMHEVTVENHDRVPLRITEMGWGSQNDFNLVAFEQGIRGQVRQLRDSYAYLLENRHRLNLKDVYWYSWKDLRGSCSFCDSVGLFREGLRFRPKPAWHAFVAISGGRARP
jgi:polysaccharide biosynthesis protein PslG